MKLNFSIIIPVYNRPNEIDELLESLVKQDFSDNFEVLIIEDGSENSSEEIVEKYKNQLRLKYFFKETGFDLLEHDGSYPGQYCASTKHVAHESLEDSQWKSWKRITG